MKKAIALLVFVVFAAQANAFDDTTEWQDVSPTSTVLSVVGHYSPRCETAAAAWQVPNDWRLGYLLRTTQESGHFDSFTTNAYFQIFSNVTETASTTLAAVLAPVALDRLSGFAPTGVTYSAVSPGVTIAGNVATAPTGGVFRIRAADPVSGGVRYADIPLDHRTSTGETVEYYFADAANQQ